MKKYTEEQIKNMDYSSFVGLINERNRPSGGIKTVHTVAVNAFINQNKKVLEIGSNTGFTSVNLALLTGCEVVGIDINQESVNKATEYAQKMGVQDKVKFICATATKLPFENSTFDMVWASNVTSFISNKNAAIEEYFRVLKTKGTLAVIPIYYRSKVPASVIANVSEAIGAQIKEWNKQYWLDLFFSLKVSRAELDLYYNKDFSYQDRDLFIQTYVNQIVENNIVDVELVEHKDIIKERFLSFMKLFNENLKYAGFSVLLFQKKPMRDEIELFLSHEID